jgi:hypothetical protein
MKSIYGERNVIGPPITFNYEEKSSLKIDGRAFRRMRNLGGSSSMSEVAY